MQSRLKKEITDMKLSNIQHKHRIFPTHILCCQQRAAQNSFIRLRHILEEFATDRHGLSKGRLSVNKGLQDKAKERVEMSSTQTALASPYLVKREITTIFSKMILNPLRQLGSLVHPRVSLRDATIHE